MIVLALDLSLSCTGYAVANVQDGEIQLQEVSHIDNKKWAKKSQGFRLHKIAMHLKEVFKQHDIEVVVKEKGFTRGHISTQALFKVAGVADLLSFSFGHERVHEYSVTTIKKVVAGHGKASKEDVAAALSAYVGEREYATDDESDAVAVLIAYCIDKGLVRDY